MSIESELKDRADGKCELCSKQDKLIVKEIFPSDGSSDGAIMICETCNHLMGEPLENPNHWRCLNDAMWSPVPAIQVASYRILKSIESEGWPQDMLDMLYLEPEILEWAKMGLDDNREKIQVRDANGNILSDGDSVVIIKDLPVKGAGFTAKQGTTVKNIKLVADDSTHIEGRVNGVRIYLKSEFLKKA